MGSNSSIRIRWLFAALALPVLMPAMASEKASKQDVIAFNATVRVEVDASGKPTKVEAPGDLPAPVRSYIETRVASWQYEPARINDVPAAAVTFVHVGACAIPVTEGFRLGLDFKGNGPMIAGKHRYFLPPPMYPLELMRVGAQGDFKVSYVIQKNGSTRLVDITPMEGTSKRHLKAFRSVLADWVEDLRYTPEQVAGEAVETELSIPVNFMLSTGGPQSHKSYQQQVIDQALASRECFAAKGASGLLPIASNSPIKVTPAPAT